MRLSPFKQCPSDFRTYRRDLAKPFRAVAINVVGSLNTSSMERFDTSLPDSGESDVADASRHNSL